MWLKIFVILNIIQKSVSFYANLGDVLTYKYKTNIDNDKNSLFDATIKLSFIWENVDNNYYQTSLSRLISLKIITYDINAQFQNVVNSINQPIYLHSYDHQISPIIVSISEDNFSLQIKKALASIFQLTGHNMTERDIHHDCLVTYRTSKNRVIKKKLCEHPSFSEYSVDRGYLKSFIMKTATKTIFTLDHEEEPYVKSVRSFSCTKISSVLTPEITLFNATTRQDLTLIGKEKLKAKDIIHADNLNQALLSISAKYSAEFQGQPLKFNPKLPEKIIDNEKEIDDLKEMEIFLKTLDGNIAGQTVKQINAREYVNAIVRLRNYRDSETFKKLVFLIKSKYPRFESIVIDLILATQTSTSWSYVYESVIKPYYEKKVNNIRNSEKAGSSSSLKGDEDARMATAYFKTLAHLSQSKYVDDEILTNITNLVTNKNYPADDTDETLIKTGQLLNTISIIIWRKCVYNPFCFRNANVKDTILNRFYKFIETEIRKTFTKLFDKPITNLPEFPEDSYDEDLVEEEGDVSQAQLAQGVLSDYAISLINSLGNVKTVQSAILLAVAFDDVWIASTRWGRQRSMKNGPDKQDLQLLLPSYFADILIAILKAYETFPCSTICMKKARQTLESFGFFVPSFRDNPSVEDIVRNEHVNRIDNFAILPLINEALFSSISKYLPRRASLTGHGLKVLLRCDKSQLFIQHFTTNLVHNVLARDRDYQTFIHSYHVIGQELSQYAKIASPDRSFYRSQLIKLLPNYWLAISKDSSTSRSFTNAISKQVSYETFTLTDKSGIPLQFLIQPKFLNQPLFKLRIETQNLGKSIQRLTSLSSLFFSAFGQGTDEDNQPVVTLDLDIVGDMIDLHGSQDPKESKLFLSNDALVSRTFSTLSHPLKVISNDKDLTALAFSDTSNKKNPSNDEADKNDSNQILNENYILQDMDATFCLSNGFHVYLFITGVVNVIVSNEFQASLFDQTYSNKLKIELRYYCKAETKQATISSPSFNAFEYEFVTSFKLLAHGQLKLAPNVLNLMQIHLETAPTKFNYTFKRNLFNTENDNDIYHSPSSVKTHEKCFDIFNNNNNNRGIYYYLY